MILENISKRKYYIWNKNKYSKCIYNHNTNKFNILLKSQIIDEIDPSNITEVNITSKSDFFDVYFQNLTNIYIYIYINDNIFSFLEKHIHIKKLCIAYNQYYVNAPIITNILYEEGDCNICINRRMINIINKMKLSTLEVHYCLFDKSIYLLNTFIKFLLIRNTNISDEIKKEIFMVIYDQSFLKVPKIVKELINIYAQDVNIFL